MCSASGGNTWAPHTGHSLVLDVGTNEKLQGNCFPITHGKSNATKSETMKVRATALSAAQGAEVFPDPVSPQITPSFHASQGRTCSTIDRGQQG